MKNLAELQRACTALGIDVPTQGRQSKEPYIAALQAYHWHKDHPDQPLPPQIRPMLLDKWADLDLEEARLIEHGPGWIVQPKLDGVRALLHVEGNHVRITSRCVSEVTFRLGEFQDNLPHLAARFSGLDGTILDGELVFPGAILDTGRTIARHPLQAATAILSTSPEQSLRLQAQAENRLRFLGARGPKPDEIDPKNDIGWNREVTLKIGPHPKLKDGSRRATELDYGMVDGVLEVTAKACLVQYFTLRFGLDRDSEKLPPTKQQIVLLNRDEIEPILKSAGVTLDMPSTEPARS